MNRLALSLALLISLFGALAGLGSLAPDSTPAYVRDDAQRSGDSGPP